MENSGHIQSFPMDIGPKRLFKLLAEDLINSHPGRDAGMGTTGVCMEPFFRYYNTRSYTGSFLHFPESCNSMLIRNDSMEMVASPYRLLYDSRRLANDCGRYQIATDNDQEGWNVNIYTSGGGASHSFSRVENRETY